MKTVFRPLYSADITHSITTNSALSHKISQVPISAAKKSANLFRFKPLLLLLGIKTRHKQIKASIQLTNISHCCRTFTG